MATKKYPSKSVPKGSVSSFPTKPVNSEKGDRIDDYGNPYFNQPKLGRDTDEAYRNRRGDFGKQPQDQGPMFEDDSVPVMPKVIHGV